MCESEEQRSQEEYIKLETNLKCPNCGHSFWVGGPRGGGSQNIMCGICLHEYNHLGPFGLEPLDKPEEVLKALYGESLIRMVAEIPRKTFSSFPVRLE